MEHSEYTPSGDGSRNGNGATGMAAKAEEKVRELGEKAQLRIEDERERTASRIDDAASRLRDRAGTAGPLRPAGEMVAVRMEAAAGYMHRRQTKEIAGDFAEYVREHPFRSILVAAFLGYLLGRLTS
jgi:ElaB/YqjD/DUF883 family membrane-anchored ribosome-binding protein